MQPKAAWFLTRLTVVAAPAMTLQLATSHHAQSGAQICAPHPAPRHHHTKQPNCHNHQQHNMNLSITPTQSYCSLQATWNKRATVRPRQPSNNRRSATRKLAPAALEHQLHQTQRCHRLRNRHHRCMAQGAPTRYRALSNRPIACISKQLTILKKARN